MTQRRHERTVVLEKDRSLTTLPVGFVEVGQSKAVPEMEVAIHLGLVLVKYRFPRIETPASISFATFLTWPPNEAGHFGSGLCFTVARATDAN